MGWQPGPTFRRSLVILEATSGRCVVFPEAPGEELPLAVYSPSATTLGWLRTPFPTPKDTGEMFTAGARARREGAWGMRLGQCRCQDGEAGRSREPKDAGWKSILQQEVWAWPHSHPLCGLESPHLQMATMHCARHRLALHILTCSPLRLTL